MLLSGKPVSKAIDNETEKSVRILNSKGIFPTLAIIRIGEKPDDLAYERMIKKRGEKLGIEVITKAVSADASQFDFETALRTANFDREIHGIILMRPFPNHINEEKICSMLSPEKDIDGVTATSIAHVFRRYGPGFPPCTAEACLKVLKYYDIDLTGKNVVVAGRSLVIGKPVALLLTNDNATVTVCHSKTRNSAEICSKADILITAIGKPGYFTKEYLNPGMTVIDVGINITENGITGDLNSNDAQSLGCSYTPVPGGIGSVTSSLLLAHTAKAAFNSLK